MRHQSRNKMKETDNNRLKAFRQSTGLQQGEFAQRLGLKQGSYSDIERGRNAISYPVLKKAMLEFDLNPSWLISGIGGMTVAEDEALEAANRKHSEIKDPEDNIILVEQKAAAGYLQGIQQDVAYASKLPSFRLPGFYGISYRAFEVTGYSMLPSLNPKDILVCKRLESPADIKREKVYVVVMQDGSIVAKRLQYHKRDHYFTAISDNAEEYPAYDFTIQEVFEIWQAEARITNKLETDDQPQAKLGELEARLLKLEKMLRLNGINKL